MIWGRNYLFAIYGQMYQFVCLVDICLNDWFQRNVFCFFIPCPNEIAGFNILNRCLPVCRGNECSSYETYSRLRSILSQCTHAVYGCRRGNLPCFVYVFVAAKGFQHWAFTSNSRISRIRTINSGICANYKYGYLGNRCGSCRAYPPASQAYR